jgi:hypothetical protein
MLSDLVIRMSCLPKNEMSTQVLYETFNVWLRAERAISLELQAANIYFLTNKCYMCRRIWAMTWSHWNVTLDCKIMEEELDGLPFLFQLLKLTGVW